MATVAVDKDVKLPRVAITFCTQCKWMLRAAYFGQELLSTFGTSIGEIALVPATGGLFQVNLTYQKPTPEGSDGDLNITQVLIWDRKTEGGFPETKVLKQLVRNHIEPSKDLGHSDTAGKTNKSTINNASEDPLIKQANESTGQVTTASSTQAEQCTDCT